MISSEVAVRSLQFTHIYIHLKVTTWFFVLLSPHSHLFTTFCLQSVYFTRYPQVCFGSVTVWYAHSPRPVSTPGQSCLVTQAGTCFCRYHPTHYYTQSTRGIQRRMTAMQLDSRYSQKFGRIRSMPVATTRQVLGRGIGHTKDAPMPRPRRRLWWRTGWQGVLARGAQTSHYKACTEITSQDYFVLAENILSSLTSYYKACRKHSQYYVALQKVCRKYVTVLICTTKLAESTSMYLFAISMDSPASSERQRTARKAPRWRPLMH